MTLTVAAYLVYLPVTFFITIRVGWVFFKNGQHYIDLIVPDHALAKAINRMLLIGYYLVNLGYVTMSLSIWARLETLEEFFDFLSMRIAIIMVVLGVMHFVNMAVIWWYGQQHAKHSFHPSK